MTERELFRSDRQKKEERPLAFRMRPVSLDDVSGQTHIIGPGKLLRRAIEADRLSSVIFYGPPGTGKTALALVISRVTGAQFARKNAVSCSVKEIRKIAEFAQKQNSLSGQKTILLLDEIHRFSKAQQDVLLPEVEEGNLILVGTTTENPYFSVNAALLSRSQIFEFKPLSKKEIIEVLDRALYDKVNGFGERPVEISERAKEHLAEMSDGDARKALGALELAVMTTTADSSGRIGVGVNEAEESIQKKAIVYDRAGDSHYDTASAYIKSMRGSDPDAALYWLAKMIVAGESPRFIARRMVICAAEDVGLADPNALNVAISAMQAADFVGFPEARIPLAEATVYLACAPKSNSVYEAIDRAVEDVKTARTQEVPDHLKDASYKGAGAMGRGKGYKYSHSYEGHYVEQKYLGVQKRFYFPTEMGIEKKIKQRLENLRGDRGKEEA